MRAKVVALGNILMEDDGIGIKVLENIEEELAHNHIESIIGETDVEYCISQVKDGDFIFIIDASYNGKVPGTITVASLQDYKCKKKCYTQHSYSFIDLIGVYYKSLTGFIIEIEVASVSFKLGLSYNLQNKLKAISKDVLKSIFLRLNDRAEEEK
ncbi:hydrogenase maturation protease [Clostridium coskatii]|uniref:Hydrogenase 2 maturation endopeptidase n=1 Tax=Clostridium coskatii TaxID=1705578 RepID=A0A166TI35_9CLOT|nr:hydrogenase maturation protease [Clostridium coskatii]OAA93714.1 hydrogenase 2 maturation endopeptidase [Clostridium coskatii]OBR96004.1 hydrogenase 2 maturation endopeptidase [Clostridium coskatii]